jgi:anti-sigma factor RsiW
MEPRSQDDELIERYLLGELSEEEQTRLEERAFSDPDHLPRVRAGEKDLIDEYVRGELSDTRLLAFERRFFASEHRRRQIEFARAFTQVVAEGSATASSEVAPAEISSRWNSFLLFRRGPHLAFRLSLAAIALVVIVGGVWLLREFHQSREQAQVQPQVTPANPVAKSTEERAQNEPQPAPSQNNPPKGRQLPQPVVASLLLLPGTSRGAESHPQLTIAPAASTSRLRVVIESGDEYKTYAVELRTISGKMVRNLTGLPAHPGSGGRAVVLTLPAKLLTTGEYELTLNGINEQKRAEPLGYYYFSVRKE